MTRDSSTITMICTILITVILPFLLISYLSEREDNAECTRLHTELLYELHELESGRMSISDILETVHNYERRERFREEMSEKLEEYYESWR